MTDSALALPTHVDDAEVLVIGGGLLGCAISYYLAQSGVDVVLVDKDQLNRQASGRNAGSLHFQLEYRMIENGEAAAAKAAQALPLHLHATQAWKCLEEELGEDLGVVQHGGFMVAEDSEQVRRLERKIALEREFGLDVRLLDKAGCQLLAPYFGDSVVAASFCPEEGKADPRHSSIAFARAAARRGARVLSGYPVDSLRRDGRTWHATFSNGQSCRARQVVIAAGSWSGRVAQMAGIALPVSVVGLTMTATVRAPHFIEHLVQHVGRRLSMKQTAEGNVLIGGGWPAKLAQYQGVVNLEQQPQLLMSSVSANLRAATEVVPAVKSLSALRFWTGATALVADQLPLIGEVPKTSGLYVAAGGSAFTLGPTYARVLSDLVLGKPPLFDIRAYDPQRFGSLTLV